MHASDETDQPSAFKRPVEESLDDTEKESQYDILPQAPNTGLIPSEQAKDICDSSTEPRSDIKQEAPKVAVHIRHKVQASSSRSTGNPIKGATAMATTSSSSSSVLSAASPSNTATTAGTSAGQVASGLIAEQFAHIRAMIKDLRTAVHHLELSLAQARVMDTSASVATPVVPITSGLPPTPTNIAEPLTAEPLDLPPQPATSSRGPGVRKTPVSASSPAPFKHPRYRRPASRSYAWKFTPDHVDRMVFKPLMDGTDTVIQVRSKKLRDYVAITLVDAVNEADPRGYAVILVNSCGSNSTRGLLTVLREYFEDAELSVDIKCAIDDRADNIAVISQRDHGKPAIFVCTPNQFAQLTQGGVLGHPDHHILLVMYEAEYILGRSSVMLPIIQETMKMAEPHQIVVAVMHGSTAIHELPEKLQLRSERVIYSMDYDILHSVKHFYFQDASVEATVLNRMIEIGQTDLAVVICSTREDIMQVKDQIQEKVKVYSLTDSELPAGVLVTTKQTPFIRFSEMSTGRVRMIANLSGGSISGERYIEMMLAYLALGDECDVVLKVSNAQWIKNMETSLGITIAEVTLGQSPFVA
ncbi:hypothetical protein BGZ73_007138 [Actinomortierella ambigua]|nr:hypothetical protein BGZ73_007138 [Actinomortierella ambigua]